MTPQLGRHPSLARWLPLLFVLAILALVGSVLLPAAESARVLALLGDDAQLIEPARIATAQIESGMAEESAELQHYIISRDSLSLRHARDAVRNDDRRLGTLVELAARLDGTIDDETASLALLVRHWRTLTTPLLVPRTASRTGLDSASTRDAVLDSIALATATVDSALAHRASERREALATHELRGLAVNAVLVVIALAAVIAAFEAMRRERRRSRQEEALRVAAEALAETFTTQDVALQIARSAMDLLHGDGAIVVKLLEEPDAGGAAHVASTAGAAAELSGVKQLADLVHGILRRGEPLLLRGDARHTAGLPWAAAPSDGDRIIIPLGTSEQPVGAVVVDARYPHRIRASDCSWAGILGHLSLLAYEKVRLLEEARAGRTRLERVMESRNRLMRGFSHDVKNPLGAADGYAALLEDGIFGALSDDQRRSLSRMRTAIQQALSRVDDLHELARAETGKLAVQTHPTDVAELVSILVDLYRATAATKRLAFVGEVAPAMPTVFTDASRVRQVVGNLLSNAIKYCDAGSITLRARIDATDDAPTRAALLIEVIDTGPGIPSDKIDLIFEEFARLPGERRSGAGLGLAISKHVAEALGGCITVRSEIGRGSTFALRLPLQLVLDEAPAGANIPSGETRLTATTSTSPSLSR